MKKEYVFVSCRGVNLESWRRIKAYSKQNDISMADAIEVAAGLLKLKRGRKRKNWE